MIPTVTICSFVDLPYYLSMPEVTTEVSGLSPTLYTAVLRLRRAELHHQPIPVMWGYCDTEEEALTLRDSFLDLLTLKRAALQLDADSSAT